MANDIVVRRPAQSPAPSPAPSPATPEPRAPPTAATPMAPLRSSALPNPSLRIDPALGVVVIEFRDSAGKLTRSFPDPRQLAAYRDAARTGTRAAATTSADTAARPIHRTATPKT